MKQLLHALYITEPDVVVRREGESLLRMEYNVRSKQRRSAEVERIQAMC